MHRYSVKLKKEAVKALLSSNSSSYVCKKFHISKSTLYYWKDQYYESLKTKHYCVTKKEYLDLVKENEYLKKLLTIYKTTECSPQSPEDIKLSTISQLSSQYPIKLLCDIFDLDRNKYYRHIHSSKTLYELRNENLRPQVLKIFQESNSTYGAKRICAVLQQSGHIISKRKVSFLMKEQNLVAQIGKKKKNPIKNNGRIHFLIEKYAVKAPNIIWLSDVTEYNVNGIIFYICLIEDLFSRYIVSYAISSKADTALLLAAFDKALATNENSRPVILHSDNGTIYKSFAFREYLKAHHMHQSFSRPGRPTDNSAMESFICTLKKEGLYRTTFPSYKNFRAYVEKYIDYYNNKRIHSKIGYKTPKSLYSSEINS